LKFEREERFRADFVRLSEREQRLFLAAVREINEAYDRDRAAWPPAWPARLRIKAVLGATGVWEMTWSFAGPDGRATFQFVSIEGEPGIRWRRIGGHEIFREP
jgi:hypothetical protein